MTLHLMLICAPAVLGLLIRQLRRPQPAAAELTRIVRDLLTLRMVLRGSEPCERRGLLAAHHHWRIDGHAPRRRSSLPRASAGATGARPRGAKRR